MQENSAGSTVNYHQEHKAWVSQYRQEIKGFAIFWVVFFHALLSVSGALLHVQRIGYGGVDMFLFLTGFGLFHSLQKSDNLRGYWKRRMTRILPSYLPLIVCWLIVMLPQYGLTATQALRTAMGNLFMVGFWLNVPKVFNWYIGAQLLVMVLAPFAYARLSQSKKLLGTLLWLLGASFCIGLCCIDDDRYMGLSRIPVFLLGMAFAMDWKPRLSRGLARLLLWGGFVLGLVVLFLSLRFFPQGLTSFAMYWHPFMLIAPTLCIGLAFLLSKLEKAKAVCVPFRLLGAASFEIYLLNIWMVELGKRFGVEGNGPWLLISLGSILLGIGYHLLVGYAFPRVQAWWRARSTPQNA